MAASIQAQNAVGCGVAGGRDEVDGPAQVGRTVLQGIGSFVHFNVLQGQWVDVLKIRATVCQVNWNTILQKTYATHVKGARQARASNAQPCFFIHPALRKYAGREVQHVFDGHCFACFKAFSINHCGAACCLVQLLFGHLHTGCAQCFALGLHFHAAECGVCKHRLSQWCKSQQQACRQQGSHFERSMNAHRIVRARSTSTLYTPRPALRECGILSQPGCTPHNFKAAKQEAT